MFQLDNQIRQIVTTAARPQTNGLLERMHAMIGHGIRTMCAAQFDVWDLFIPQIIFAIRVRKHAVTKFSPYELLYGIQPRLPSDSYPPPASLRDFDYRPLDRTAFNDTFVNQIGQTRKQAFQNTMDARIKAKQRFDSKKKVRFSDHAFEIGTPVKIKNLTRRNKVDSLWKGPFKIVRYGFPGTYFIQGQNGRESAYPINQAYLARYHE
jgi:hypothetical protein